MNGVIGLIFVFLFLFSLVIGVVLVEGDVRNNYHNVTNHTLSELEQSKQQCELALTREQHCKLVWIIDGEGL